MDERDVVDEIVQRLFGDAESRVVTAAELRHHLNASFKDLVAAMRPAAAVAAELGISLPTLQYRAERDGLGVVIGKRRYFLPDDLARLSAMYGPKEGLYTAAEVAKQLGISVAGVRWHTRTHGLGRRVGGRWMFTANDIDAMRDRLGRPGRPSTVPGGYTGKQAARMLGITQGTLRRYTELYEVGFRHVNSVAYSDEDIEYLRSRIRRTRTR